MNIEFLNASYSVWTVLQDNNRLFEKFKQMHPNNSFECDQPWTTLRNSVQSKACFPTWRQACYACQKHYSTSTN